jgi:MATE family multidrug resistance protein
MSIRIEAGRMQRIAALGIPIIGGAVSNVLMGLIDTAMVGMLGNVALAAVGISTFAAYIYLGIFWGISIAVQATASRRKGEQRFIECGIYLNAGLMLILIFAPILSAILWLLVPYLVPLLSTDPELVQAAIPYLRWLVLQAVFVGTISAFNGFWNAVDLSRIYIKALITMHLANILFNYMFIFGNLGAPEMGVEGAGFATAMASVLGTLMYIRLGFKYGRPYGFPGKLPTRREYASVIKLAIPAALQQFMDSIALTLMYRIVGLTGTMELAAYSVLINFINLVGLPAWGLGTAGATLVGQALGRKDVDDASRWAWDVIKLGVLGMGLLGLPFWLVPDLVLSIWIHDEVTRDIARLPTRILGLMIMVNGIGYMLSSMLNGAGDVRRVTYVNFYSQWFWLLPGAYFLGPYLGLGLIGIWCMHQFGYRARQSLIYAYFWRTRLWAKIKI